MAKHPGFEAEEDRLARRINPHTGKPYGKKHAGAILAYAARHASTSAKRANPRLKRVRGA